MYKGEIWQIKSKEKQEKVIRDQKQKFKTHKQTETSEKTGTSLAAEWQYCIILETNTIIDIHTYKIIASQKGWIIKNKCRSSHYGTEETNLTSIYESAGSMPGLAQWVKDLVLLRAVV